MERLKPDSLQQSICFTATKVMPTVMRSKNFLCRYPEGSNTCKVRITGKYVDLSYRFLLSFLISDNIKEIANKVYRNSEILWTYFQESLGFSRHKCIFGMVFAPH